MRLLALLLLLMLLSQLSLLLPLLLLLLLLQVLHWWDAAAVGLHSTPLRAVVAHPKGFICGGDSGWIVTFRRNPKTAEHNLCRQLQPCAGADILELQLCGASHAGDSPANFNHMNNRILMANGRGELGHLDGAACFPSAVSTVKTSNSSGSSSGADASAAVSSSNARVLSFGAALDAFQADLAATTAAALADTSGATAAGAAADTGSVAGTVATASTGAAATAAAATANSSAAAAIRTALYTPCVTGLWTSATADLTTAVITSSNSAYSDHTTAGGAVSVTRQPRTVACRLAQATRKPLLAVLNAPAEALDPAELLIWDYRCREVSCYKASFVCAEQSSQFCSKFFA
jgi:hypothetical protein